MSDLTLLLVYINKNSTHVLIGLLKETFLNQTKKQDLSKNYLKEHVVSEKVHASETIPYRIMHEDEYFTGGANFS